MEIMRTTFLLAMNLLPSRFGRDRQVWFKRIRFFATAARQFAVACYLCWMAGEGQPLPATLPPELVPPSKGANPF